HPLTKEHLYQIVDIELSKVKERMQEHHILITVSKSAKKFLIEKGTSPEFGARPLKRVISKYLEDPLSEEILKEMYPERSTILVDHSHKKDKLTFKPIKKGETLEENKNSATVPLA
ncbi:MAG: ATP-dependent Clp protease ATP-binding subunit ClpC, partial [Candidatus Omnitrophica bacterium]|nr:ATP-dependent Clp protease ATP-binding subunit ClpC [Candidatus Omnitrophota bacterium]